ncbi:unnamed protein product [Hermetia illucens]|uniref:Heparan sulfate 2-O-sulfotransferase pipe n=2 Tax=Hermetia illucens TaxID=343691 RepID=A0A7R8UM72_HERIL|nr:unnamed protein product [Hermetia illucens]
MDTVFFNRVPKVGSETLIELMKQLSDINGFTLFREKQPKAILVTLGPIQQLQLAEDIADLEQPAAYVHHVNFINFTHLEVPRPIYINMVRDPVERVISWFYYARAPWVQAQRQRNFPSVPGPKVQWLKKDFESCVRNGDKECNYIENSDLEHVSDHRRQTLFFCGHSRKDCMPFNSERALQIAKRTVESEYAVVGSWTDVNVTLTVLEHYIPKFFKGAHQIYHTESGGLASNTNPLKPHVSEEIKARVRANFSREIEFYEFCRQRLHKQYLALRLDSNLNY